mgnify:CR=1 FL=1
MKSFELYQEIIKCLLKEYSTSIEEDEEMEEEMKMGYEGNVAVTFRKEYKKILKGQEVLANKCMSYLKRWELNKSQKIEEAEMKWVRRLKPYLSTLEESQRL